MKVNAPFLILALAYKRSGSLARLKVILDLTPLKLLNYIYNAKNYTNMAHAV